MKLAIDSYSYHRYFGEVYPMIETDPISRMTMPDFLERAALLGVQGVSIESCFISHPSEEELFELRQQLERLQLDVVWAWGHPTGLQSGMAPEELSDLTRHVAIAASLGARVMRICCGGRRTRPSGSWAEHKCRLLPLLRVAAEHAQRHDVVLAIENHIDFLADELVDLIETLESPQIGVCLDTANNLRLLEDPMKAIEKLAPYARATHIKDVTAYRGNPHEFSFWPSVPTGRGLIDFPRVFETLRCHNYTGLLALEIDYLHPDIGDEQQAIEESLNYLRETLKD